MWRVSCGQIEVGHQKKLFRHAERGISAVRGRKEKRYESSARFQISQLGLPKIIFSGSASASHEGPPSSSQKSAPPPGTDALKEPAVAEVPWPGRYLLFASARPTKMLVTKI